MRLEQSTAGGWRLLTLEFYLLVVRGEGSIGEGGGDEA